MFQELAGLPDQVGLEREVLRCWRERGIFDKLRARNRGGPRFSFLDGPITANNPMGVHHAWGRTLKDLYQRYWAMRGRDQRYQNGFDCQGLWVEVEVERELGFTSKRDIEAYGVAEFIARCKERVDRFADTITQESIRLGCCMDWGHSYRTDSEENNYAIWHFLKKCHQRELVYPGTDVMPWCPRCGTGLSQQELQEGYKEIVHPGVVIRLPLTGRRNEFLLVWTTTPWTLTANVACAVNPGLVYLKVRQGEASYYVIASRAKEVMTRDSLWRVEAELPGRDLVGFTYVGPFDDLPQEREPAAAHVVLAWSDVSEAEGTGIVHIAPGCGKEDYDLGREHGLPVVAPIDENGRFRAAAGPFAGMQASEAAEAVPEALRQRGFLYRVDPYQHRYPHCWRCGSEVLFRLVDEWFIAMDPWRDEIMHLAREVKWIPDYGREVELDWLRNMRDWMISKKRYWGLALPIWRCECGWFDVIGGREDLRQRVVAGWQEFCGHLPHRPWVDAVKIKCGGCGGQASRIPDVGNPWLDAGIVPYSTMGYFEDREEWERWFPADLVIESLPGQFRNWFYVLLAMSAMLEGRKPVSAITGYSTVVDESGEEMHKSKGNAIWFAEAADTIGADPIRWLSASQPLTQPMRFGLGKAEQVQDWLRTLWNVYSFLATYANVDGWPKPGAVAHSGESPSGLPLDRWLRARVAVAAREISEALESFAPPRATAALLELLDALSNWWVRRSRRRFWKSASDADKEAAYGSLHGGLIDFSCLLAPFMPFTAEALYQRLAAPFAESMQESVHLCTPPTARINGDDSVLLEECERARTVVRLGRSLRAELGIRVRQPLPRVLILNSDTPEGSAFAHFELDVLDELNVKAIRLVPTRDELGPAVAKGGGLVVGLDITLTDELVEEGVVRDLIRHIQNLRRRAGLRVDQRIKLWVRAGSPLLDQALRINKDHVAGEVLAVAVNEGEEPPQSAKGECRIAGERVILALAPGDDAAS